MRLKERVGEGPGPGTRTPRQGVAAAAALLGDPIRVPKRSGAIEVLLLLLMLLEENRGGDGLLANRSVVELPLSAGRGALFRGGGVRRRGLRLQASADVTHCNNRN